MLLEGDEALKQCDYQNEAHDRVERRIIRAQPKEGGGVKDVVLVDMTPKQDKMRDGIKGHRIGQLRLVFRPLQRPGSKTKFKHLAFIEWFTVE
ncbi:hypothetical protein M422DRAFT_256239 [Sphaerobolus stellatus SS14]|uniref:Uncharacterized protein n=1 Tax=Sphaerobolus stellatus (strain SS14) TaxID=990650 RepID=A0A0C9VS21_SPHS4|nr:hypothetical protein M422DRAFT_256239 [Sphaerobolus stellatus SS14]